MAITSSDIKLDNDEQALQLIINNGDLEKITQVMNTWNFRDHQSFMRFVVSIMLDTEDKFLAIKRNQTLTPIKPSDSLVKTLEECTEA